MSLNKRRLDNQVYRLLIALSLSLLIFLCLLIRAGAVSVFTHMRDFRLAAMALTMLFIDFTVPLRVIQWHVLLPKNKTVKPFRVLQSLLLGYIGNSLFPMGGGDLFKTYHLSATARLPFSTVLASVALIRLQDMIVVLLIVVSASVLAAGLPAAAPLVDGLNSARVVAFVVVLVACFLVLMCFRGRSTSGRLLNRYLPRIGILFSRFVDPFSEGLAAAVAHPYRLVWAQVLAVSCWLLFMAAPIPLLLDLGLPLGQALICAVILTGAVNLALLLPITPAGLGTYHVVCVLVLSAFATDIPYDQRLAFAFVSHAIGVIGPALLGIPVLPLLFTYRGSLKTSVGTQESSLPSLPENKERTSNA